MKTCQPSFALAVAALCPPAIAQSSSAPPTDAPNSDSVGDDAFARRFEGAKSSALSSLVPDLPLTFLENVGQWDTSANYVARRGPVTVSVESHVLHVAVARDESRSVTRFHFEGASDDVSLEPLDPLPGLFNVYSGSDPDRWAEGLVHHERLAHRGLYDGIDVVLRSQDGHLEYDVLLAPGADLERFVVRCEGVERLEVDDDGGLLLHTEDGVLRQSAPITWVEDADGERTPLECRFVLIDDVRYGFALADRPTDGAVTIDPGLEWSTYLGGSDNDDFLEMGVDAQGRLVLVGITASNGWALPGGTLNTNGGTDAIVIALDTSVPGSQQVAWWTNYGGSGNDVAWDVQINAAGDVFITGATNSSDFPITANAYDAAIGGGLDGYVARLQAQTGTLQYTSYLGGSRGERTHRILLEEPATVTIGGSTRSDDLPTTADAIQPSFPGTRDYFLTVMDLDQSGPASLRYMSYFGGTGQDGWITERQMGMTFDANGDLVVVGSAFAPDLPAGSMPAYSPNNPGGQSAFVAIMDLSVPGPAAVKYRTYLGSTSGDGGMNVVADPTGGLVVAGFSYGADFPVTSGCAFPTFNGPSNRNDTWVAKLDPSLPPADQLVYATYLPGDGYEAPWDVVVGADGTIFVTGWTGEIGLATNSLPVTCGAFDESFGGDVDAYVMALSPNGNGPDDVHYLSYFGGSSADYGGPSLLDPTSGTPTLTMSTFTSSNDAPTTPGAFQSFHGGAFDAMVSRLRLNPYLMCVAGANSVSPDGARICATGSVVLADNALDLTVTDLPQNSAGFFLLSLNEVPAFMLPPPSGGSLCLGTPIVRFAAFVQFSGTQGSVTFQPDLGNIPPPGSALMPGDTAYFQYWYRDVGNTSNTSNGVAVTLE